CCFLLACCQRCACATARTADERADGQGHCRVLGDRCEQYECDRGVPVPEGLPYRADTQFYCLSWLLSSDQQSDLQRGCAIWANLQRGHALRALSGQTLPTALFRTYSTNS